MNAKIEEIERQLHELRNFLGPVELLLANMETQIMKTRAELERRVAALETRFEEHLKSAECRSAQLSTAAPPPSLSQLVSDAPPRGADLSST